MGARPASSPLLRTRDSKARDSRPIRVFPYYV
jgi:hypothetical protein